VIAAAVIGAVAWAVMRGEPEVESRSREVGGGEVAAVDVAAVEPAAKAGTEPEAIVTPPPVVAEDAKVVIEPQDEVDEVPEVEPPKPEAPEDIKALTTPKRGGMQRPAGPPSDSELKKKLARKIVAKCAAELAGKRVTVVFDVTPSGEIKRLTAMPKGPAGECAKQQVAGTKFRARGSETNIEIEVG
jgi:hypothetical protein